MRVLITGWRNATSLNNGGAVARGLVLAVATARLAGGGRLPSGWRDHPGEGHTLVHGACAGVDAIAHLHALRWNWNIEPHPATGHPTQDFGRWPEAGPRRNNHMVSLGADIVLGMPGPGSRGTIQCVGMAIQCGLRTLVVPLTPRPAAVPTTTEGVGAA